MNFAEINGQNFYNSDLILRQTGKINSDYGKYSKINFLQFQQLPPLHFLHRRDLISPQCIYFIININNKCENLK